MIIHGYSPYGMLVGTMVPLPKGKWKSKRDSENYRAITLSSLLGKLLDLIIIFKEGEKLETDNPQFGYKKGLSTTMCTSILRETVSYYNNRAVRGHSHRSSVGHGRSLITPGRIVTLVNRWQ